MRIDGRWLWCDDGVRRPVLEGEILAGDDSWEKTGFLIDTGADRTVFSAATLAKLRLQPLATQEYLSGLGGMTEAVIVETQLRLTREGPGKVVFRGQFTAVTALEALDISVLGRDITGLFAVIVDPSRGCLPIRATASLPNYAGLKQTTLKKGYSVPDFVTSISLAAAGYPGQ